MITLELWPLALKPNYYAQCEISFIKPPFVVLEHLLRIHNNIIRDFLYFRSLCSVDIGYQVFLCFIRLCTSQLTVQLYIINEDNTTYLLVRLDHSRVWRLDYLARHLKARGLAFQFHFVQT